MPNFLVTWKMDVDDSDAGRPMTPRDAADYCRSVMLDPESTAVCFDVLDKETERTTFVDLASEDDENMNIEIDDISHLNEQGDDGISDESWKPVLLNPATELDKAMAALRKTLSGDASVMDDPHGLVDAAEAACDAHEAMHAARNAEAAMTGGSHAD